MKKIICIIMATLVLFALVGCGGSTTTAETSPIPSNTAKTATDVYSLYRYYDYHDVLGRKIK